MVETRVVPKSPCRVLAARSIARAVRGSWSSVALFGKGAKTLFLVPKWRHCLPPSYHEVVGYYFLRPALCSCYRVRAGRGNLVTNCVSHVIGFFVAWNVHMSLAWRISSSQQ